MLPVTSPVQASVRAISMLAVGQVPDSGRLSVENDSVPACH